MRLALLRRSTTRLEVRKGKAVSTRRLSHRCDRQASLEIRIGDCWPDCMTGGQQLECRTLAEMADF